MKIFLALSGKLGYNVISDNFITFLAPIFASIFVISLLCNKLYLSRDCARGIAGIN